MKLFTWIGGRQASGYDKMPLFISKRLKLDLYLIRFPVGAHVPTHKDPVEKGYKHHRLNYMITGNYNIGQRMYVLGPSKRFWRFIYFRPDVFEHGLQDRKTEALMISLGWLTKSSS